MAVALSGTPTTVDNGSTVNKPGGSDANTTLYFTVEFFNGGGNPASVTITPPAGLVLDQRVNLDTVGIATYTKSGTGAEANYAFTIGNSDYNAIICRPYSGVDLTTPIASGESTTNNGTGTAVTWTGVDVDRDGSMEVASLICETTLAPGIPDGFGNAASVDVTSSGDLACNSGSTGNETKTLGGSDRWGAILSVLQAAGGGGGGGGTFPGPVAPTPARRALLGVGT